MPSRASSWSRGEPPCKLQICNRRSHALIGRGALHRMTAKLLEAEQRNMWEAQPETLAQLKQLYMEIEGEIEDRSDE